MKSSEPPPGSGWLPVSQEGRDYFRVRSPDMPGRCVGFLVPGVIAGRYEVGELLSLGELTLSLLARDRRTRRAVVVKALRGDLYPESADVPDGPAALTGAVRHARHVLQTERRLLVRLRNAGCNAVPVPIDYVYDRNPALTEVASGLDPFLIETEPYLVLQYLAGETLEEVLRRKFPSGMGERQALRWILPVVRALEVVQRPWRLGSGRTWHCVYQDLKPANLMLDPVGRLTLLDFGGCQVVVDGVPVLVGSFTPGYAPPECESPARVLLGCADVYSIGRTLLHMLSGVDPRARLARGGENFDAPALPAGCSPGLRDLLTRCLAPKPSQRPADARKVAEVITGLLAS